MLHKFFSIFLLVLFNFYISNNYALASAWQIPPKKSNLIITEYIDDPKSEFNASALEIFYEYGISKKFSLIFEQSILNNNFENNIDESYAAIKFKTFDYENWVGALQFGVIADFTNFQNLNEIGFENRILLGRGFNNNNWLNFELAYRNCNEQTSNRWEITAGHSFKNQDKIILKNFGENDACSSKINRTQLSYVKNFKNKFAIELGTRISHSNEFIQTQNIGFIIGIWHAF